eukprot:88487-Lingulodinium_polyedra.AAC.1
MCRASLVSAEFAVHHVHAKAFGPFCSPAFPHASSGRWADVYCPNPTRPQALCPACGALAAGA